MDTSRLVEVLLGSDAVRFGEFELAHGGTSSYYIDKYRFETDPEALSVIAEAFADRITEPKVAGVALGAVPLVAVTSVRANRPSVIVRKETKDYGTQNRIEGTIEAGENVVLIEDIATTGKSALSAVKALREAGAIVDRVLVVVDREEGARELLADAGVELEALVTATQLLDAQPVSRDR